MLVEVPFKSGLKSTLVRTFTSHYRAVFERGIFQGMLTPYELELSSFELCVGV